MCTALSLSTNDGKHFFGRNLDTYVNFNQAIRIVPRNYQWINPNNNEIQTSKYACIGMGIIIDNQPLLFDGVNEHGLAGGGLNFTRFAKFNDDPVKGKVNISASNFFYWALSSFKNLDELLHGLDDLILTNISWNENVPVAKLHWMFTDKTGKSIVVEYMADGMHIHINPVGVLTNDPTFQWHLANLSQYVTLSNKNPQPKKMGNLLVRPYGHGTGMCGLPGDGSPASRFVRTVFFRDSLIETDDEVSGVTALLNILSGVSVIKGSEVDEDGALNYTVYRSAICLESKTYYYTSYYNRRINAVSLSHANFDGTEIITYPFDTIQDINYIN